ncbi:MAG: hypothetical protein Q7R65_02350 [bacterium]|nr:hypothetical protein [bacterium]
MKLRVNGSSKTVLAIFLALVVWWIFIAVNGLIDTDNNYWYGIVEGLLPCVAAFFGFANARQWGGFKSAMGKAVNLLSIGLLTWGIGTVIFGYYNIVLQIPVPYPSLADAFYIISWPLWAVGMIYLSRATGAQFQLSTLLGRSMLFLIPILTIIGSYYVLIIVARQGTLGLTEDLLTDFFDLAYPIGDIVILTIALLIFGLSFKYLGGFFKWACIIILAGFVLNYIGDFSFVYLTTQGTYFVADWVDLIYTVAFFCLSFGVTLMDPRSYNTNEKRRAPELNSL